MFLQIIYTMSAQKTAVWAINCSFVLIKPKVIAD
jgi:hypothetical protein